ncbi:MAG: RES domain-containing protein [Luteitalea sp.]|nr:RES domain-containing protein [Luteitalea sp.]
MTTYRIVKTKWAASAFDGEGARRDGGRWNSVGTPMVYTAESRSLAALEVLVNLEGPARGYSIVRCSFPDTLVVTIGRSNLPPDWQQSPAPPALAALGDAWVARASSVVLAVPSAVIPEEVNHLLNPTHPDFDKVTIYPPEPHVYDERLVARTERSRRRASSKARKRRLGGTDTGT